MADHTKFGRAAMVKVASLDDIDMLVTDLPVPTAFQEVMADAGVKVLIPEGQTAKTGVATA